MANRKKKELARKRAVAGEVGIRAFGALCLFVAFAAIFMEYLIFRDIFKGNVSAWNVCASLTFGVLIYIFLNCAYKGIFNPNSKDRAFSPYFTFLLCLTLFVYSSALTVALIYFFISDPTAFMQSKGFGIRALSGIILPFIFGLASIITFTEIRLTTRSSGRRSGAA